MGLKSYVAKLDDYFARQARGKTIKIKPSHVQKVITKLKAKKTQLRSEIAKATKPSKKQRLERKLLIAKEHIKRAELLLDDIT